MDWADGEGAWRSRGDSPRYEPGTLGTDSNVPSTYQRPLFYAHCICICTSSVRMQLAVMGNAIGSDDETGHRLCLSDYGVRSTDTMEYSYIFVGT